MTPLRQSGFTLVEALVAGMVMVVIAGVIFTVFVMHHVQLRESSIQSAMQRQYENVSAQIARAVRAGRRALKPGESYVDDLVPFGEDSLAKSFLLYDATGTPFAGYSVATDTLREWNNGWQAYEAGGGPVLVTSAASSFVLPTYRNKVALLLTVRTVDRDSTYTLSVRRDAFVCRN
jgi:type II secretory pathway pseudopilin PulG